MKSMDWNAEDLLMLSQCFQNTLSPSPIPRREAENSLYNASSRPNYSLALLRLVSDPLTPEQVRQSAVVYFKNHLRFRWCPSPDDSPPLPDPEKDQIKTLILPIMLNSPPRIQSQLSESLSLIGKHDFPKLWPSLLPSLVDNLRTASLAQPPDYASINGILGTANSIFKKFRYQYKTNELLQDLKYCLDAFASPLLETFLQTARLIEEVAKGTNLGLDLRALFESQRLCCRIFYSLNFQELPEFFEDHMTDWMVEFEKYLTSKYPVIEGCGNPATGATVVDELRAAICENISLYMEKNEEEFKGYLDRFASAVWSLLGDVSQNPSRDRLAINAIKFLTTVSTSVHHTLFAVEGGIHHICQRVVIPNVILTDEDEELFDMNYVEFIRRDMEGSDLDTRRRIACELLKGIATNYKAEVTRIVSSQIQELLTSFSTNPMANWKDKDCAIFLVVSLSTRKAGSGGGVASTDLVDVQSFFRSVIVPELQSKDVNDFPMLKAGALKFFTLFRHQIPKDVVLQFIPDLARFLMAASCVVHSYAANCIEKLLLVKDEGGKVRYNSSDIALVLPTMMTNLFAAIRFAESEENHYVMKCIMRVLGLADITSQIAAASIACLTSILSEVCKNPKNPVFNHYLFESVAVLVRRACETDASLISSFEGSLFPSLQTILANDVAEFFPYAFQLLAQLVDLNRPPIPATYMPIFEILLSPDLWGKRSNVPALVRLLQAFLQKSPHELSQGGRLIQVLDIFNGLMKSTSTEEQGFFVLNTVFENLEYGLIAPHVAHIWFALFDRLQKRQTMKFVKSLLIFMSLFLVKHGSANLVDSMNSVQPNIFSMILEQIWISNLRLITGSIEIKLTAVASTRLLCESPVLLDAAASSYWGKMLDSILTLLSRPEEERVDEEPEVPDIVENAGYTATFVSLHYTGKKEEDPLKDVRDPREFLVSSLARLSAISPGKYPQIISANVEPPNQAALLQLCTTFNCPIV